MSSRFTKFHAGRKVEVIVDSKEIRDNLLNAGCSINTMNNGKNLYLRMRDGSYASHLIMKSPASEGIIRFKNKDTLDLRLRNLVQM